MLRSAPGNTQHWVWTGRVGFGKSRRRILPPTNLVTSFRFRRFHLGTDQTLWLDEKLVHLSPMQRRLLLCFCRHPRQVLSKGKLMEEVWGSTQVSDVSLARTVHGLRSRLSETDPSADPIRNIYGEGYIFTETVEAVTHGPALAVGV
jgi:DNA-binding winged helix-turn-helix (wHTH) protein